MAIKYDTFLHGWLALMSLTDHHVFKFPNVAKEMEAFKREAAKTKASGGDIAKMDFDLWAGRLDGASSMDRLPEMFNSTQRRKENV